MPSTLQNPQPPLSRVHIMPCDHSSGSDSRRGQYINYIPYVCPKGMRPHFMMNDIRKLPSPPLNKWNHRTLFLFTTIWAEQRIASHCIVSSCWWKSRILTQLTSRQLQGKRRSEKSTLGYQLFSCPSSHFSLEAQIFWNITSHHHAHYRSISWRISMSWTSSNLILVPSDCPYLFFKSLIDLPCNWYFLKFCLPNIHCMSCYNQHLSVDQIEFIKKRIIWMFLGISIFWHGNLRIRTLRQFVNSPPKYSVTFIFDVEESFGNEY